MRCLDGGAIFTEGDHQCSLVVVGDGIAFHPSRIAFNFILKRVGVVLRRARDGVDHHIALAGSEVITFAAACHDDTGSRFDDGRSVHVKTTIAGVRPNLTIGNGLVTHARDQRGVTPLVIIAIDGNGIDELQSCRFVVNRAAAIDVVVQQH